MAVTVRGNTVMFGPTKSSVTIWFISMTGSKPQLFKDPPIAKTKVLISSAVTAQVMCAFVFA